MHSCTWVVKSDLQAHLFFSYDVIDTLLERSYQSFRQLSLVYFMFLFLELIAFLSVFLLFKRDLLFQVLDLVEFSQQILLKNLFYTLSKLLRVIVAIVNSFFNLSLKLLGVVRCDMNVSWALTLGIRLW